MPPRRLPEWIGETADAAIPPRVWKRILDRYGWKCARCGNPSSLTRGLEKDHIKPLVEFTDPEHHGNRENNYQPLCPPCHGLKTKKDTARKSERARKVEMRSGYKSDKPSRYKETKERLKVKFNWKTKRYERYE